MPEPPTKRYWDSSAFLAWIKGEAGRADTCESIVNDAQRGACVIYTSMITLAEVTKTRRGPVAVSEDVEPKITSFFMNEYVRLIPVDHVIGTRARRLIWDSPFLGPRDAIHIATALQVQADAIEHYDNDFARVAREVAEQQTAGFPPIREPQWTGQPTLPGTEPTPPRALDTPQSN